MADSKNDTSKTPSNQNKGSGSDTASAAKISAGTSVGNVGASPMPQSPTGTNSPSSTQSSTQSSTLASHTSKPLGGQAGATGAGQGSSAPGVRSGSTGASPQGSSSASQGGSSSSQGGMSETARQTAQKAQEKAEEAYDQTSAWARDTYERASSWASDAYEGSSDRFGEARSRSMQGFGRARRGVEEYVSQNPVMVGLVGLAAGLLIGALLPRTRREDRVFGAWADEVREQGLRYAHEMTQRGRDYVDENFSGDEERFSRHESEFTGQSGQPGSGVPGRH
jgi:ElaB/YqjD/DUF883 family membrane-anchored ribosome-binding protein